MTTPTPTPTPDPAQAPAPARTPAQRAAQVHHLTPNTTAIIDSLAPQAAKLLAVEILLADAPSLGDDVLEECLYILHDRLTSQ